MRPAPAVPAARGGFFDELLYIILQSLSPEYIEEHLPILRVSSLPGATLRSSYYAACLRMIVPVKLETVVSCKFFLVRTTRCQS